MPNLLPLGFEEETITADELSSDKPIGYRNGPAFDYETGDYKRDGKNRIIDADGIESWRAWVINCMSTQRYACLAYDTDFGIEWDKVFAAESHEEAESILVRQITEAVLADPYGRCEYVEDIKIDWTAPDAVAMDVTLHGIRDVTLDITAYITKEAS